LFATKHGCPSVIPLSISWKSASASEAADTNGCESLYAIPDSVDPISSRYTGRISSDKPSAVRNSRKKSSASIGRSVPSRERVMLSASISQWSSANRVAANR
jgi:hypothetical protein